MKHPRSPWPCIALALGLLASNDARAVDVWITSGDRSRLLEQQPDLVFRPGDGSGGSRILVLPENRFQTIEGFGAALTNSSAWLLQNKLDGGQRDRLVSELFSQEDGIGLNYLRLPMGASDFTADGFYTYNDLPLGETDPQQTSFSIDPDRQTIIPSLQAIKAVNEDLRLMASPWSAPGWMKTSGSVIGGILYPTLHGSYATYLKKFIQAYDAEGLPIDAITLQNEPLNSPSNYPGMLMSSEQQIELIKNHVRPQFAAAGISTKILAYDHNWDNTQYPIDVLNDPEAAQYVAGVAFHGYAGDVSAQSVVRAAHPDKSIHFTEISGGDFAPNFEDNLVWLSRNLLIGVPRNWGSSILLWNLALDENYGPHLGGCEDCRGVVTVDSGGGGATPNEEFYALGHLSRHVQAGAERVASTTISNSLETVAFRNPDGSRVLLALNPSGSSQPLRAVDSGQHFAYDIPARSVATFVWDEDGGADFDNGGFEQGGYDASGGSLDGWLAWGVTGQNVTVTPEAAFEGEHALSLSEPASFGGFSGVSQGMSIAAGDRVVLDAEVMLPGVGSIAGTGSSVLMKVEYYSSHGGEFQSNEFLGQTEITIADGATAVDQWQPHLIDDVAPAGAVEARFVLVYARAGSATGQVLIDDIGFAVVNSLAGDFNGDGVVDAGDYAVWRDNFGAGDESALNFSGDGGGVGLSDYELWRSNYGAIGTAAPAEPNGAAPEPCAAALLLHAAVAALLFRR
ncbi:MAG: glycoside hydrolase family 30 beta sandwich domain-containing protein [Planctomycetota bacterium]